MKVRCLERGATLIEVLVAAGLMVTLVAGLAHLLIASRESVVLTERSATAVLAAQDRLERLRALTLRWDLSGAPVEDGALAPSPSDALDRDADGYSDVVDARGRPTSDPGAGEGVFTRRWTVAPLGSDEPAALGLEVCVFGRRAPVGAPPVVCLATVRTRQP
jgi:type II secretory pathway pseudopilin PulG